MFNNPNKARNNFYVMILLLSIWIILTELFFPGTQVFPSPSLVIISIYDLFNNYNFISHLASTVSVVYVSMLSITFIVKAKFSFVDFHSKFVKYFLPIPNFFLFVPEIIIGLLLIFWLGDSYFGKLTYAVIISGILVYKSIIKFDENKITDHIIAAKSVGLSDQMINRKIIWKFIEPDILNEFIDNHTFLWSTIIAFEFIQNYNGIGFILRRALEYHDISLIVSLLFIITILILLGDQLLKVVRNKYLFWN